MELKIYNSKGTLKLTVSPSSSSTVTEEVMGEYCVCATFVHTEFVVLDVNDYVLVDGVKYKLRRNYKPEKKNSQCFNYQVKFHAPIHDAEDALFLFMADDDYQTEFSFDGTPQAHLQLWVDNMNRIAGSSLWSIGTVITGESKTIDYRNVYCWEAAFGSNGIAATFDTELWADGFVINLCKASRGVPVTLGYMQGLKKLQRSDSGNKRFFTRLFPLGSTRNIDATKYGSARLQLPSKAKYVDRNTELYGIKDAYEEAAFADIYPKYVGKVTAVRTGQKKSPEGRDYTVYYFQDNGMDFDPSLFEIPELVKMVSFQTGDLAGYGDKEGAFQANWDPKRKEWEIINVYPDETTQIPGGTLIPKVGDSYIPWNFRMPDSYLTAAEQAYQEAVNHFVDTYSFDPDIYTAPTDRNYIENNQIPLQVGQNVVLASDEYFRGIKETRITKVVRKLNDLNDATITCTDKIANGWKAEVENNLTSLDYKLQKQIEQTMIDLIRTSDTKTPSDYNVFSSLKSISTFVRKDRDDRTPNKLSTDKAFEVGNFVTGASGAIIYKDKETGQTIGELDKLYVRMKAYFETLEIINTNSVGGKQNISPGGSMKCVKVEEAETYWRCYLLVEQDGAKIENRFHVEDLAYSKIFNAKPGVSNNISNNYYWRKVIAIGEDYIDLSKSHCDAGSEAPKVGDIINQRGNEKDKDRQSFIEFSAVDAFSPSITLYQGVNSYSLVGKDVVSFGVDKTTGKAFMNVYGDMYVGDREQKSYMRYTQEDGLEIKGKLGVGSTYNGKTFESFMHNTFTKQPTDEEGYGVGDMWVNATYPSEPPYKYEDQLLRCVTAKQPGEPFSIDHWIPAASYKGDKIAEEALKKAEDAGKLANELKQTVGGIKDLTDKAFADGIISIGEKAAIEKMLKQIETTKQQVTKTYSEVYNNALLTGVPKTNLKNGYDAFVTACNELVKSITDTIADAKATSTEIALVDGKYDTFNVKYGDYMAYLAAAEKSIEDSIKTKVDKTIEELGGYKYLKAALKEQTTIQNGLVLSTLIGVGQTMDTGEHSIMAGISGIYDSGKRGGGIASWFGGSMVDKFDYYDAASGKFNVPQGVRPATGVDRMDGTGYRANGALWWDNDGKVHADPLSFFVGESTVGALLASFQVVTKSDGKPNYIIPKVPFQSLVISDHLAISDNAYLRYDAANKAVYVVGPNGEEVNFYATGDVSAFGKGTGSTGGGSSVTIVDNLLSSSTDAALSANQGRVLKGFIDEIKQQGTGGVSNWKDLQGKPTWITDTKPSYSWGEITGKPVTFVPSEHNHPISQITGLQGVLDGKSPTSHTHNYISFCDSRSTDYKPYDTAISKGISIHLKSNGVSGLDDGGIFYGIMHINQWMDNSAGNAHQLAFTDNSNIWHRHGRDSWGGWKKILDSSNYTDYCANKTHVHSEIQGRTITDLNQPHWNNVTFDLFHGNSINTPTKYNNANGVINLSFGTHGTNGQYGYQLAQCNGTNTLFFRQWTGGSPAPWRTFAFQDDTINNSNNLGGVPAKDYIQKHYFDSHNQYICLGTLTTVQGGDSAHFDICTGNGFNAEIGQNKHFTVYFRTSNGSSNDGGRYYAAECVSYDDGIYSFYIVQNSQTSYSFWIGKTNYAGGSILEVKCSNRSSFKYSGQAANTLPANAYLVRQKRILYTNETSITVEHNTNPFYHLKLNGQSWFVQIHQNTMYLGRGTESSIRIDSTGNLISPKEITAYSDERLKSNIKTLENRGYITPITYVKDGKQSIGLSAQEVRKLYPELVHEDEYGKHYLSVNYAQYVAVLQAQVIDLQRQIDELKKEDI